MIGKLFLFICTMSLLVYAQESEFPKPIVPGEPALDVPSNFDTLWVLTHSQYKKCIKNSLNLIVADSMYHLLDQKSILLQNISANKDSIIKLNTDAYMHYAALWEKTDRQLETVELKNVSLSRQRWYFGIGGIVAGLLIGIFVF